MQKFVENNPEGPDICLLAVAIENHAFGGHVLGRSDVQILKTLPKLYG